MQSAAKKNNLPSRVSLPSPQSVAMIARQSLLLALFRNVLVTLQMPLSRKASTSREIPTVLRERYCRPIFSYEPKHSFRRRGSSFAHDRPTKRNTERACAHMGNLVSELDFVDCIDRRRVAYPLSCVRVCARVRLARCTLASLSSNIMEAGGASVLERTTTFHRGIWYADDLTTGSLAIGRWYLSGSTRTRDSGKVNQKEIAHVVNPVMPMHC
jgi:hypothetical protein